MFYPAGGTDPYPNCPKRPWQCVPIKVEQVGDRWFRLSDDFDWRESDTSPAIRVTDSKLGPTDLASIPFFLRWFAAGYGRHTPAALLHDQLRRTEEAPKVSREKSDRIFLVAMRELGVPLVRRLIMWAAVVTGGRALAQQTPSEGRLGLALVRATLTVAWLVLLVLVWLWALGIFEYEVLQRLTDRVAPRSLESILVAAVFAPVFLGLLWDREFLAGIVAGWALPVFLPFGMVGVLVTFLLYGAVEVVFVVLIMSPRVSWFVFRFLASLVGIGSRPPWPQPVPGPTPWGGAVLRWLRSVSKRHSASESP